MKYIGPHVSIKENISLSAVRAHELSATGFAIFTKNQRQWKAPQLKEEDAALFRSEMRKYGYSPSAVLPHAGYLINPATPDEELRKKSLALFLDEAGRTVSLGLEMLNIHPGAFKEGTAEDGIKRAAAMMDEVMDQVPGIRIAIENTAGAGTVLGSSFEELDMLLSSIRNKDRTGFTLDTAHLFGAGFDVKNDPAGQTSLTGWLYRGVAGIEITLTNVPDSVKKIELLADTIYTKVGASHYDDFLHAYEAKKDTKYEHFVLEEAEPEGEEENKKTVKIVGPNLLTNICTSLSLRITSVDEEGKESVEACRLRLRDVDESEVGEEEQQTRSIPSDGGNGTGIIPEGEVIDPTPEDPSDDNVKNPYRVCFKRNNYYRIEGDYTQLRTFKYTLRVTVNPNWDMDVSLPLDKSEGSTEQ